MSKPTFEAGIAFTLAELVRMTHIGEVEARNVLEGIGHDLSSLKAAGAAAEDIAVLKAALTP